MSDTSATIRPAPADASAPRLATLRHELDRVDDAIHDALMRRAELVAQVGALNAKSGMPLRPGREAAILRRLLARNRGALAPSLLVRVWREMLAGSSAQQNALTVAVADPALLPTARAHFGQPTTLQTCPPGAAIDAVAAGTAGVALLPMPGEWWSALLEARWRGLHIVARLPFWGAGPDAMLLSAAPPDPSGADRTVIAGPEAALTALHPTILARSGPTCLAEIDGFLDPDALPSGAVRLGAYAIPLGDPR